jgi:hypothetical protein
MAPLMKLAMQERWIYEVVISTYSDGTPHAAPIGVWRDGCSTLEMEIFSGSQTLKNILASACFAVNFPADVGTLFSLLYAPQEMSYGEAREVRAPTLLGCSAVVEMVVARTTVREDRVHITGRAVETCLHTNVRLINRAEGLLLESLILATRIPHLDHASARTAIDQLRENYRIARKVALGSWYESAVATLLQDAETSS